MKTFTSGAKSSEESPRYDLIPLASLQRQAARMAQGSASHGERNYRRGYNDPVFIRDRVNHLLGHALAYASGDRSEDHLGAVLANAGMLAELEALRVQEPAAFISNEQPAHDERFSHATPATCGCPVVAYPPGPCLKCDQQRLRGASVASASAASPSPLR
jgi:hypothetical protein